jgi:hypothetical protein
MPGCQRSSRHETARFPSPGPAPHTGQEVGRRRKTDDHALLAESGAHETPTPSLPQRARRATTWPGSCAVGHHWLAGNVVAARAASWLEFPGSPAAPAGAAGGCCCPDTVSYAGACETFCVPTAAISSTEPADRLEFLNFLRFPACFPDGAPIQGTSGIQVRRPERCRGVKVLPPRAIGHAPAEATEGNPFHCLFWNRGGWHTVGFARRHVDR